MSTWNTIRARANDVRAALAGDVQRLHADVAAAERAYERARTEILAERGVRHDAQDRSALYLSAAQHLAVLEGETPSDGTAVAAQRLRAVLTGTADPADVGHAMADLAAAQEADFAAALRAATARQQGRQDMEREALLADHQAGGLPLPDGWDAMAHDELVTACHQIQAEAWREEDEQSDLARDAHWPLDDETYGREADDAAALAAGLEIDGYSGAWPEREVLER